MPKFKVTKTFTKKATIVKIIEADKAINAEINVALSIKDND
ncbi:hypothetical protein FACS1894166_12680 [Bacilli bacterium]|nr:hypothetical protein FACS1894166_12680 [Bacilli bacterium]